MNPLFSLYDALISINVPSDKALAVVEAMGRDMDTTLATKTDRASLGVATRADLALMQNDLDAKYRLLHLDIETTRDTLRQEMVAVRNATIIRLGSALVVAVGVILTALGLG